MKTRRVIGGIVVSAVAALLMVVPGFSQAVSTVPVSGTADGRYVNATAGGASERANIEVRAEFFNVLNHANFNDPSATLTSATFGRLTSAGDPRILQFSLKLHY